MFTNTGTASGTSLKSIQEAIDEHTRASKGQHRIKAIEVRSEADLRGFYEGLGARSDATQDLCAVMLRGIPVTINPELGRPWILRRTLA